MEADFRSSRGLAAAGFERMRTQFQDRRQAHFNELERAMGEVDTSVFLDGRAGVGVAPDFALRGALPPTTSARVQDVATSVAITRGEKQAARELIAQGQEAERAAKDQAIELVKSGAIGNPPVSSPTSQALVTKDNGQKGWEKDLAAFYRQAESERTAANTAKNLAKQEAEVAALKERIERTVFERKHFQREADITTKIKTLRRRAEFDQYRNNTQEQLNDAKQKQQTELEKKKEQVRQQKAKTKARKEFANLQKDFVLRHGMLDKTCRQVDAANIAADLASDTIARSHMHRERFAAKSRLLESRRALVKAQEMARNENERDRHRFLYTQRRMKEDEEVRSRRENQRANKVFDKFLRDARNEVVSKSQDQIWDAEELSVYENTLAAFQELADGVRSHSQRLATYLNESKPKSRETQEKSEWDDEFAQLHQEGEEDYQDPSYVDPLLPAAPRVRELFDAVGASPSQAVESAIQMPNETAATLGLPISVPPMASEAEVSTMSNNLEEMFKGLSLEEDQHLSGSQAWADVTQEKSLPELPALPATVPPLPLRTAVAPLPPSPRIPYGPHPTSARIPRGGPSGGMLHEPVFSSRETNSFAATRMIRRTGPIVR